MMKTIETMQDKKGNVFHREITLCDSCSVAGIKREADGHCKNPEWAAYDLCDECIAEYDGRLS